MSSEIINERAQDAAYRSSIYGLLARIFLREVDDMVLEKLQQQEFAAIFDELGEDFGRDIMGLSREEQVEELAVEFTRLFLGPGRHLSPHESVYVSTSREQQERKEGLLWGGATVKVHEFMASVSYQLAPEYQGIPDHLGVELELMHHLAKQEQDAWMNGDTEQAMRFVDRQKYFLEEHILKWVPRFCRMVSDEARNSFYRTMAKLTAEFVAFDHDQLSPNSEQQDITGVPASY